MKIKNLSGTPMWRVEQGRKLHNTFEVQVDHTVNGDLLKQALEKTLNVYRIMKSAVLFEDGTIFLVDNPKPYLLLQGKTGFIPGCENSTTIRFMLHMRTIRFVWHFHT